MEPFQSSPMPESQKIFMPRLAHDLRAAISYTSFYPVSSHFVTQSVQKLREDFQKFFQYGQSLIIRRENEKLYINDYPLSTFDDLLHLFQRQNIQGVEIIKNISIRELTDWLQIVAFPQEENIEHFEKNQMANIRPFDLTGRGTSPSVPQKPLAFALNTFESFDILTERSHAKRIDGFHQNHQALLGFVEETWQFFQTQQKNMKSSPETTRFLETFDVIFQRLLDRMEKPAPDFEDMNLNDRERSVGSE